MYKDMVLKSPPSAAAAKSARDAACPVAQSEGDYALEELSAAIEKLSQRIGFLEQKISPVLKPQELVGLDGACGPERSVISPLFLKIRSFADDISCLDNRVHRLIDSVAL